MSKATRLRDARRAQRLGPYVRVPRSSTPPIPGVQSGGGHGSDIVMREPVLGRCYLCHVEQSVLLRSHVTPKWAARVMKAERTDSESRGQRPRGAVYRGRPGDGATSAMQDTEQHYMLCSTCEQWLSAGERTLERIANGSPHDLAAKGLVAQVADFWIVSDQARTLVWRALLGTVVKLHYAPSSTGHLSDKQAWALAERVTTDNYLGLVAPSAVRWYSFATDDRGRIMPNPRALVVSGLGAHGLAEVMIGGILWFVPLGARVHTGAYFVDHQWTHRVGDLNSNPLSQTHSLREDESVIPFDRSWSGWPLDAHCPCGSGADKKSCCANGWVVSA